MIPRPKPGIKRIKRTEAKANWLAKSVPAETPATTYDERVSPDRRAAQAGNLAAFIADVKAGKQCFATALELREEMNRVGIKGLNLLWRAGKAWQRASDKNQYDLYFYDYADTLLKPEDRAHVTKEVVRVCLHLANNLPEEIKTVEQAAPLVQKCFVALGFEEAGRRLIETAHPPRNIFSDLVSEATTAIVMLRELKSEKHFAQWTSDEMDTFLREWKPVVEDYAAVQRLRQETRPT